MNLDWIFDRIVATNRLARRFELDWQLEVRPPATRAEIQACERELGFSLPLGIVDFYETLNGFFTVQGASIDFLPPIDVLTVQRIALETILLRGRDFHGLEQTDEYVILAHYHTGLVLLHIPQIVGDCFSVVEFDQHSSTDDWRTKNVITDLDAWMKSFFARILDDGIDPYLDRPLQFASLIPEYHHRQAILAIEQTDYELAAKYLGIAMENRIGNFDGLSMDLAVINSLANHRVTSDFLLFLLENVMSALKRELARGEPGDFWFKGLVIDGVVRAASDTPRVFREMSHYFAEIGMFADRKPKGANVLSSPLRLWSYCAPMHAGNARTRSVVSDFVSVGVFDVTDLGRVNHLLLETATERPHSGWCVKTPEGYSPLEVPELLGSSFLSFFKDYFSFAAGSGSPTSR